MPSCIIGSIMHSDLSRKAISGCNPAILQSCNPAILRPHKRYSVYICRSSLASSKVVTGEW